MPCELRPSYAIPAVLAVIGVPMWFLQFWLVGGIFMVLSVFLSVQTATLRLIFTDTDLDIYRLSQLIRRFPYQDWQYWQIFWQPIPILFYFKEVKSIHFLPIIFDAASLSTCLETRINRKDLMAEIGGDRQ